MPASAHIGFIAAAYTAGVVVIGALVGWVVLDYRWQRRFLTELEKKGISRRSARQPLEQTPAGEYDDMTTLT